MRVVVPYRSDNQNGTELMFAIRSMVRYFTDMTGIVLVGDKPKWYKGDHIPYRDIAGRVDYNMYAKLMQVRPETVLYTQDDVFALKPFDKNIPNYYNTTCGFKALHAASGRHRTQYKNCPKEWLNFDIHAPMVIDTSKFKWTGNYLHNDTPVKSTYGNQNNLPGEYLEDCKFGNEHTYDQIKAIIDGRLFFSTDRYSMKKDMEQVLNELYPEKSEYEC